jgi:ATPase subunit of ABC transporter with duplicated ATPase domains
MPIATISSLDKSFGKRVIFDKLDFLIDRGERVGLIGPNGAGKSTQAKSKLKAGSSPSLKRFGLGTFLRIHILRRAIP